jgi:hypothetical protein
MQSGDIVKHKKDKTLIQGKIREISKSGIRARVIWEKQDNPLLLWPINAYYRLDLLELKSIETSV